MMPQSLLEAIAAEADAAGPRALARAAGELSEWYRAGLPGNHAVRWSEAHRVAYAATRMPATYAAVAAALEETAAWLSGARIESHLDLCAGPGTAVWAAAVSFSAVRATTCVERDAGFVALGARLLAAGGGGVGGNVGWLSADVARGAGYPTHDLVTICYGMNEIAGPDRALVLREAWNAARVALVIVEPGTPAGSAVMLDCRTRLLAAGAHVAAPCPHAQPCPLAGDERRWCHFSRRLARTRLHRAAKGGDLGYEDERFAYVAVSREATAAFSARIIGHPHATKAGVELELCGAEGVSRTLVAKRDRDAHRLARRARWGDAWGEE